MRNKYGKISYFRDWEAFANGYPHIHVLLIFHEHKFKVFRDHNGKWRIYDKSEFERGYHSFVDVQAVRTLKGSISYVTKYLMKSYYEDPSIEQYKRSVRKLTLALCWLYRKQSFAVSGDLHDLIRRMHNSNFPTGFGQVNLDGKTFWVCMGVYDAQELGILDNSWFVVLDFQNFLGGSVSK